MIHSTMMYCRCYLPHYPMLSYFPSCLRWLHLQSIAQRIRQLDPSTQSSYLPCCNRVVVRSKGLYPCSSLGFLAVKVPSFRSSCNAAYSGLCQGQDGSERYVRVAFAFLMLMRRDMGKPMKSEVLTLYCSVPFQLPS